MEHSFKELPTGPDSGMYDEQNRLITSFGVPLENVAVEVESADGGKRVYLTDQEGTTPRFFSDNESTAKVRLVPDEFVVPQDADTFVPRTKR